MIKSADLLTQTDLLIPAELSTSRNKFKKSHINTAYTDECDSGNSKYETRKSFCKYLTLLWPQLTSFDPTNFKAIVEGSWLCMKFLRGVPVVDKFDEKNLSYQGLSGQKYTLDFFLSAGLQMSTLRKVIQDSDFNRLDHRLYNTVKIISQNT